MTTQQIIRQDESIEIASIPDIEGDEFLSADDLIPVKRDAAERTSRHVMAEIGELTRENKWDDIIALIYPVAECVPELAEHGLDIPIRSKAAFALGMVNRFDDAIAELSVCVEAEPDNFMYHSQMAYVAYSSLYAAKNRALFLSGNVRSARIDLAHTHFERAQALRPGAVTNFYRQGMLYKEIEGKSRKAVPLFERAAANWERRDESERERYARERKHYIKALYQLASALLDADKPMQSLNLMRRCSEEDADTGYISTLFKLFALGKIQYHLNRFDQAEQALMAALKCSHDGPMDFVYELLARTCLALDAPDKAMNCINKVPESKRKPYIVWTEADARCALKDLEGARNALIRSKDRDGLSRHKTLIRLAKIDYLRNDFVSAEQHAHEAERFYREKWGNEFFEGLFWISLCAYRRGDIKRAHKSANELKQLCPDYPKINHLLRKIMESGGRRQGGES